MHVKHVYNIQMCAHMHTYTHMNTSTDVSALWCYFAWSRMSSQEQPHKKSMIYVKLPAELMAYLYGVCSLQLP